MMWHVYSSEQDVNAMLVSLMCCMGQYVPCAALVLILMGCLPPWLAPYSLINIAYFSVLLCAY